ncbi:CHASE2 domain-containing protein [Cohnella hongkongensis]|uniref:CHASE2 domain-containing protein n=1 Tax=Cohnella hongkongensis TaxID=178337 RepID=A0ABV9FE66_9BACL
MKGKIKRIAILLNAVLLLALFLIYQSGALRTIDTWLLDYDMRAAASHQADDRIVMVAIDDASLAELGRFPWDRAVYAPFLDTLNSEGNEPKAIAFDIIFSEASDNPDSDMAFAQALAAHSNVILPVTGLMGEHFSTSVAIRDEYIQAQAIARPYELFSELVHLAHINRVTSKDAVVRQTWLHIQGPDGEMIPSLAWKAAEMAGADLSRYAELTDPVQFGEPVAKNTITIDYQLTTDDFLTVSFIDVLNGSLPPDLFKDAIVFVGFTAVGLTSDGGLDTGASPIEKNFKLMYVHGNIVNQLLKGTKISYLPNGFELALAFVLFLLFIFLPWRLKNIYSILSFLAVLAGLLYGQYALYQASALHANVVLGLLAMLLAYLANVSLKSYMDSAQKSFVTRQFGRYISPDLVKQIVAQDIEIKLGGDLKHITVLFLDIRGFTPLSEKLTPPELVDTLNTMFNMITETTLRNSGTIDKFIGDAAMILFNAPLDVAEHERMAVQTAYEIQQGMKRIREQIMEKYECEVNVGIGIHSGNVVVGNIGSYLRVDYTAIGDNVNIAARIESQTKKGQVHVSEQVYERTKLWFRYDEGEDRMFKGKSHPIRVYELLGIRQNPQGQE